MAGVYDQAKRRASVRRGREKGCWVYIPAVELEGAGFEAGEAPPFYRVWAKRRAILVQLYREQ